MSLYISTTCDSRKTEKWQTVGCDLSSVRFARQNETPVNVGKCWKLWFALQWMDFSVLVKTRLVVTHHCRLGPSHNCLSHSSFAIQVEQYAAAYPADFGLYVACCGEHCLQIDGFHISGLVKAKFTYSTFHIPFVKYKIRNLPRCLRCICFLSYQLVFKPSSTLHLEKAIDG